MNVGLQSMSKSFEVQVGFYPVSPLLFSIYWSVSSESNSDTKL